MTHVVIVLPHIKLRKHTIKQLYLIYSKLISIQVNIVMPMVYS